MEPTADGSRISMAKALADKKREYEAEQTIRKIDYKRDMMLVKFDEKKTSGSTSQKTVDKEYKKYADFVKKNFDKPYILSAEERALMTKTWTKEEGRRGYGVVPPEDNATYTSMMRKVSKGNRTGRGWY